VCDVDAAVLAKAAATVTERRATGERASRTSGARSTTSRWTRSSSRRPNHWHAPAATSQWSAASMSTWRSRGPPRARASCSSRAHRKHGRVVQMGTQQRSGTALHRVVNAIARRDSSESHTWLVPGTANTRATIGRASRAGPANLNYDVAGSGAAHPVPRQCDPLQLALVPAAGHGRDLQHTYARDPTVAAGRWEWTGAFA